MPAAVNRLATSGKLLGPEQAITPDEAFRAITKAAWQYFEENRKGTLETGKLADFVILAQDPFSIDPEKTSDIEILETVKEGLRVNSRGQNNKASFDQCEAPVVVGNWAQWKLSCPRVPP